MNVPLAEDTRQLHSNPMKGVTLKRRWYCPTCLVTLTTYVTVTEPPTHRCGRRANQHIQLTEKGENK